MFCNSTRRFSLVRCGTMAALGSQLRCYNVTLTSPSRSCSTSAGSPRAGAAAHKNCFTAPPNVGPGRAVGQEANPFKSWEHMNHTWLLLMCAGCLAAGILAGRFVEVDESKLKAKFSKHAVIEAATKSFEFKPEFAATSLRVVFVLAARRAGFPADTTDESCAVVDGLAEIAGTLNYLANTFHATMEDLTSLYAIAGLKYLNGPYERVLETWRWGRNDTDVAPSRNIAVIPGQKIFSIPTILHALGDLTDEECVALMACHSVGEFHENVSGLDGVTHIGRRYTLSNQYYKFLLENEKKFFPLEVQRTEDSKDVKHLPTSMVCTYTVVHSKKRQSVINKSEVDAMLQNKKWRAIVETFAKDEDAWRGHFETAFIKMIESNFRRLRVYSDPEVSV